MNYRRAYNSLIADARSDPPKGYRELHHIIPRCMNGDDNPNNLIYLSARQHFVAHQLLVKMYPWHAGLVYAAWNMSNKRTYNSRRYAWVRTRNSEMVSRRSKGNQWAAVNRGRPRPWRRGKAMHA